MPIDHCENAFESYSNNQRRKKRFLDHLDKLISTLSEVSVVKASIDEIMINSVSLKKSEKYSSMVISKILRECTTFIGKFQKIFTKQLAASSTTKLDSLDAMIDKLNNIYELMRLHGKHKNMYWILHPLKNWKLAKRRRDIAILVKLAEHLHGKLKDEHMTMTMHRSNSEKLNEDDMEKLSKELNEDVTKQKLNEDDAKNAVNEHLIHLSNQMKIVEEMNMEIMSNGCNIPKQSIKWLWAATCLTKDARDALQKQQNTENVSPRIIELKVMCRNIYDCVKSFPFEGKGNQPIAFMELMHGTEDGTLSDTKLEHTENKKTVSSRTTAISGYRVGDGSKKIPSLDYGGSQVPNYTSFDEKKIKSEIIELDDEAQDFAFSREGGSSTEKNPTELGRINPISITEEMFVEVSSSSNSQETSNLNSVFGLDPDKDKYSSFVLELEKQMVTPPLSEHQIVMSTTGTVEADEWRKAVVVNLKEKNILSLVDNPDCPDLVFLSLQRNKRLISIPHDFFIQMPALRFLDVSETRIRALPKSLFEVKNLELLMLRSCVCLESLPSEIKNLTKMKGLDLSGTDLYEVPKELGELEGLLLLHLQLYHPEFGSGYAGLPSELIPPQTLNTLKDLQSLSIVVHPEDQRWKDIVGDIIKHVGNLKNLSYLQFYFPTVEALQYFTKKSPSWKNQRLERFKFIVGNDVKRIISRVPSEVESKYSQYEKCLRFVNGKEFEVMKTALEHTTAFYLDHHLEAKSLSDFGISNCKELRLCVVRECPKLTSFVTGVEGSSETAFPYLEYLGLHYLWELKQIWNDSVPSGSFRSLTYLMVANCQKIEYIASHSVLKCLSSLMTLKIEDCESLVYIVKDNDTVNYGDKDDSLLPKLTELELRFLPKLEALGSGILFPSEKINVEYCPKLMF